MPVTITVPYLWQVDVSCWSDGSMLIWEDEYECWQWFLKVEKAETEHRPR